MSNPATEKKAATPSKYQSTSLNYERRVLRALKARQKEQSTQFRSVSALANYLLAKGLGLDL